jgi:hypothetical protein
LQLKPLQISSLITLSLGALQGDGRRSSNSSDCKSRRGEEEEEELMAGVATRYNHQAPLFCKIRGCLDVMEEVIVSFLALSAPVVEGGLRFLN